MRNPLKLFEKFLYRVRDLVWSYPDLFLTDNPYRKYLYKIYSLSIPYSHFLGSVLLVLCITVGTFSISLVRSSSKNELVEAVVMGVDQDGNLQKLDKINPLVIPNIQLEKDLIELIYEPLIQYKYVRDSSGNYTVQVENVLVEETIKIKQGSDYQFNLKKGVKWHDGKEFTADDVIKTLELNSESNESNAYAKAIKQLQWEKIDKYSVRICTKNLEDEINNSCDESQNKPILSNFLELISVKIIPAHESMDITSSNMKTSDPSLFRNPVGTGKYKVMSINEDSITLELNKEHYNIINESSVLDMDNAIQRIKFVFYKDLESAVKALQNGEVNSLASISSQYDTELKEYPNINEIQSGVIYTQFWGLYFNLRKNPNTEAPIGPAFFQDVKVRQAISSAINREEIISSALGGVGQEAYGPIPKISYFYNANTAWYTYNIEKARQLLDEVGWTIKPGDEYRTDADGNKMQFSLYFVESYDRRNIAEIVKKDLYNIGINVIIDRSEQTGDPTATGWTLKELNEQILAPGFFDMILYGVNTFIDPDRYELYDSSQQTYPGLNIAGYVGSVETVKTRTDRKEGESSLIRLPKVDRILEQTRSFDPEKNKEDRKKNYDEFQDLLAEDAPVVFLYHPQYIYYTTKNLQNVDLQGVSSMEDRFETIYGWKLN